VWQKSQHAHAIEILKKEKKEFDSSCVGCHVTGNGKPGRIRQPEPDTSAGQCSM
jgi:hypothetical protein